MSDIELQNKPRFSNGKPIMDEPSASRQRKLSGVSTKSVGSYEYDANSHQLTLERMLNPGVFFQSVQTKKHHKKKMNIKGSDSALLLTLQQAARDGRSDIVKQHVSLCGRDKKKLNRKDEEQTTALHYAVRYGHYEIVKLLVESGANVNVAGESGATPLHYSARYVYKPPRTSAYSTYDHFQPCTERGMPKSLKTLKDLLIHKRLHIRGSKKDNSLSKKKTPTKSLKSYVDLSYFRNMASPARWNKTGKSGLQRKNTIHTSLEDLSISLPTNDDKEDTYSNLDIGSLLSTSQGLSAVGSIQKNIEYAYVNKPMNKGGEDPIVIISDPSNNEGVMDLHQIDALILPEVCSVQGSEDLLKSSITPRSPLSKSLARFTSFNDLTPQSTEIVYGHTGKKIAPKSLHVTKKTRFKVDRFLDSQDIVEESILLYLLQQKANINAKDFYGSTPLHYAAMRGNRIAVRQLLSQKTIEIEVLDRTKMTALHCACANGSYEITELLLKHGSNIRCLDEEDMTPLHFAAMEGHYDIAKLLIDYGERHGGMLLLAKMIMDQDRDEQTALHLAVENGHLDIVKLCIEKGANVNFVKTNLITPLHLACTSGQFDIVKILIESEADIESKNALQETPLHRAALFNRYAIVEYLLDRGAMIDCRDKDKETPFLMAVRKNNVETVDILLKRNADITVKDCKDKTCLYLAAEEDCFEAFQLMKENPQIKGLLEEFDKNENTPLHIAAMKGHLKMVEMLLELKACIDPKNDESLTPLHLASQHGQAGIVRLLLAQDVNVVNDEDDSSNTPLHLAALEGHVKVLEILLESGAAVDARNAKLWTALDCAASRGWTWCAECLLNDDSPIDPVDKAKVCFVNDNSLFTIIVISASTLLANTSDCNDFLHLRTNRKQTTPLHLACKEGHVEMIKLLLSRNADISRRDNLGWNCLDWAIENNHRDAAMTILDDVRWRSSLRNCTVEGYVVTTPMRKLILKLPGVAEKVFNQCIKGNGLPVEHPLYEIVCSYEFLEDTFTDWGPSIFDCENLELPHHPHRHILRASAEKKRTFWQRLQQPKYIKQQTEIKRNHPLKFMVQNERTKLLSHPLVTYLLRYKWRSVGRYVYYSKLIIFCVFLTFLTGYALTTAAEEHSLKCDHNLNETLKCVCEPLPLANRIYLNQPSELTQSIFVDVGKYIVMFLALMSLLMELIKFGFKLHHYLRIHRIFEILAYILSVIYVLESFTMTDGTVMEIVSHSRCTNWYRSLGAATVWLSWISLVLYMRKFPKLGIYVVMFTDILKTFAQFSMVFFLFIIAFGLGFHMLLYEQQPKSFITPSRAILKTTMGMLGEFEYDSVFNDVYNPTGMAWAIYVAYLVINCIILMNLLVGLAVDDIKGVQETAVLKRLAMQVDLTLDVEKALPLSMQRKLVKIEESILPNTKKVFSLFSFWSSVTPSVSTAAMTEADQTRRQQNELKETVQSLRNKVKVLETQNNRMECMLLALTEHHNVTVEYNRR